DSAHLKRVCEYDTIGVAWAVVVSGAVAYVADDFGGLQLIDVSNPLKPHRLGGYEAIGLQVHSVAVAGDYAVTSYGTGLQVFDVSDTSNPRLLSSASIAFGNGIVVSGNYAFVADGTAGLQVIDIGTPTNPRRVGGY